MYTSGCSTVTEGRPARVDGAQAVRWLVGTWAVRRLIVDRRLGATYRFEGTLALSHHEFRESGRLRMPHGEIPAERAYRLRPDGPSVEVLFPTGAHFIALEPRASQTVRHDCGADLYIGRFAFHNADAWTECWRVTGPAKRYSSITRYRRLAAA